jgi:hypothetical protein
MADMFMQVFIELDRRYHKAMVTVYLYFWGWHYLKSKYQDTPMDGQQTLLQSKNENGAWAHRTAST